MAVNTGMIYFSFKDWGKEIEEKEEMERKEAEIRMKKNREKYEKNMEIAMKKNNGYWYYDKGGIYVPLTVQSIPSVDKVNHVYIMFLGENGEFSQMETLVAGFGEFATPYTKKEYRQKYGEKKGRKWYWRDSQSE